MREAEKDEGGEPCPDWSEFWAFEDPAGSEQRFAEKVEQERAAGRSTCANQARTQVARALGLQRKFAEAHQLLDEMGDEVKLEARARVYLLLERGRLFNSGGEPDRARALFERAHQLATQEGIDDLTVDAAHMVAIAVLKEPELALVWNDAALKLAEGSPDPRAQRWKGSLYNNIGWTQFDLERYEEALTSFVHLEELRRAEGKTQPALIARWSQGKTLRKMGKLKAALELQQRLLATYEEAGLRPSGYLFEELGECKLELGVQGHAADFRRAHEQLSADPWLVEHEAERLDRLERLSH